MPNRKLIFPESSDEAGRSMLDSLSQAKKEAKEESQQHYRKQSKERLKKNVETKIRTTMIGSLSQIEIVFGFLWGHGKRKDQPLTQAEREMKDLFDRLRTEILNLGNNQIRASKAEIDQYDIEWNRYRYETSVDNPKPLAIFGLSDDGSPKKLKHGTNPDGSIKITPEG